MLLGGANGCFATVLHPLSFAQKKKASEFRCFLFWWEEVDSFNSGTGKFTCISGASAPKRWFRRNAPRGVNRAEYTLPTKKTAPQFAMLFFGGKRWIRTTEGGANRFTVCSLLATRESSHAWSWWSESNQQPADYKSAALPLSHTSEVFGTKTLCRTIRIKMVPWGGVEPPTQGFSVPCSTN